MGSALVPWLRDRGHVVRVLARSAAGTNDSLVWDPGNRVMPPDVLDEVDAVINLAGENIAGRRWTSERRRQIRDSRIDSTRAIVDALNVARSRPRILLNASAVGYYGDQGSEILTEVSPKGKGFLADVCENWESTAAGAKNVRTALLRFGMILDPRGGALGKMLPIFRVGLGGPLANGKFWMSWIARDDAVRAIGYALENDRCCGPINVVAPEPVTNAVFTAALARALRRPAVLTVPRFVLRAFFGAMADEALLASTRAIPKQLSEGGFHYDHPTIDSAFAALLSKV